MDLLSHKFRASCIKDSNKQETERTQEKPCVIVVH